MTDFNIPQVLSIKQVAKVSGNTEGTIRKWICKGMLPMRPIQRSKGGKVYFLADEVRRWVLGEMPGGTYYKG